MAGSRTLKLSILGDVDNLNKSLKSATQDVDTFGDKIGKTGKMIGAAFVAAAAAANGAHVRSVAVIQHLHAMITVLNHNQMTRAVQRNTIRTVELAVACAFLADGPQVLPVAVP
mgnify:CR=1 FL=1